MLSELSLFDELMKKTYTPQQAGLKRLLVLLTLLALGTAGPAAAQSGPLGNEWIVANQSYYKIKISRNGLYRLDFSYLNQAGLGNVDPSLLQLWRRGREVAIYQGGPRNVADGTTFLEFYGQRNDGALDADYYKDPADQPHKLYSFSTDTAAYFLTYGNGPNAAPGRRMSEPVTAGGTPHPYRLFNNTKIEQATYAEVPRNYVYFPWLEKGEGFHSISTGGGYTNQMDSLFRAILPSPAPRVEVQVLGGSIKTHTVGIFVNTMNPARFIMSTPPIVDFDFTVVRFPVLRSDITPAGRFGLSFYTGGEFYRVGYVRVIAPQANRWFRNRGPLYFQNDSLLGGPATYELDSIPATVRGYDVQDPWNVQRIAPTPATTLGPLGARFVFPSATAQQTRNLVLADAARPLVPALARLVRFRVLDPDVPNFLIITHHLLMRPAPGTDNAAREYARYRASAVGGGYDTLMITPRELYDQFHYGEPSILALRHFALWMADHATAQRPKYLLLLGKGNTPNSPVIAGSSFTVIRTFTTTRGAGSMGIDLVPTSTRSVSDNWLSSDFRNNDYRARLPTGRVPALTPEDVMSYLNKLKAHERPQPLQAWRKNALHLIGGETSTDFAEFGGYLNRYKERIEAPCFNGQVVRTYNRGLVVNPGNDLTVNVNIAAELNAGLSIINYFGHGSTTKFDINLGSPSDPSTGYANRDKYPVMFYNGCVAANAFTTDINFAEQWLLVPDKGAVGVLGETGYGFATPLDSAQNKLFQLLMNDPQWYGKPIAAVHTEVVRRLMADPVFVQGWGDILTEQLLATEWLGDPALKLYAPALPDFQTSNSQLAIAPAVGQLDVKASSPTFLLTVGVQNPGNFCTRTDSLELRVTRRYDNPRRPTPDVYNRKFKLIRQTNATYTLELTNALAGGVNVFGVNHFRVDLDPLNKEPELDETNNSAQLDYTFLEPGVTVLFPPEFAILPNQQPRLVAQTNDPNGPLRNYSFEADTVLSFDSPWRQQATVPGALVATWQPTLPTVRAGADSTTWYWRVRFTDPVGAENTNWITNSFRLIPGSPGGWAQSHHGQFRRDVRQGVEVDVPSGQWRFTSESRPIVLRTRGGGLPGAVPNFGTGASFGILASLGQTPVFLNCGVRSPNIMVVVYDQYTLRPKAVGGSPWDVCGVPGQQFYIFAHDPINAADTTDNPNYPTRQRQLVNFLQHVPDGDYVALLSMNRIRWNNWGLLRSQVAILLGSAKMTQLQNGDPLALIGRKYATGGQLVNEVGPDLASTTPPHYAQTVALTDTLRTRSTAGTITSARIGPAQQWQTLYNWISQPSATSSYVLKVQGVDSLGVVRDLPGFGNVTAGMRGLALGSISARNYPYLQLSLSLQDSLSRTAPQLREWFVTYQGIPEGLVRRDLVPAVAYAPATLTAQAEATGKISFPVKFVNVTNVDFGTPMQAKVELLAGGRAVKSMLVQVPQQVRAYDTLTLNVPEINILGEFGTFQPRVTINPTTPGKPLPELYYFNNELLLPPFTVIDRNVPPVLDVAVDGRHILTGELVSPTPAIHVQLRDEDNLRRLTDATAFTLLLQRPGRPTFELVDLAASNVHFSLQPGVTSGSIATLDYQPGLAIPLSDGVYTLRVQGHDASNATAAAAEFEVKFEVVNASTITNVFPYPNPVVGSARFVFTVTGQELPRNMKIQIMTLTGAVVKEIFMAELGPLHIGNNLTDYAWDGKDQYGDRLANGTYLYRVALDDPNGQFGRRQTAADRAFKNDWGKLVLMR